MPDRLYLRVKAIAELAGSQTKLAAQLSLPQKKLNGYLNPKSQKNLWQYLNQILELYPQVDRTWLFQGEGEMLAGARATDEAPAGTMAAMAKRIKELEAKNRELEARNAETEEYNNLLKDMVAMQKKQMLGQEPASGRRYEGAPEDEAPDELREFDGLYGTNKLQEPGAAYDARKSKKP